MNEQDTARGDDRALDRDGVRERLGELEQQVAALTDLVGQLFVLFEVSVPNEAR